MEQPDCAIESLFHRLARYGQASGNLLVRQAFDSTEQQDVPALLGEPSDGLLEESPFFASHDCIFNAGQAAGGGFLCCGLVPER